MTIQLDHVMVHSRNQSASAKMLAELLAVSWGETGPGPFSAVYVNDGLTLDFIDSEEAFSDRALLLSRQRRRVRRDSRAAEGGEHRVPQQCPRPRRHEDQHGVRRPDALLERA
jgi:hypothetical protein